MIFPKEFFEKIEYFEHSMHHKAGTQIFDKFTIHFKAWWRPRRKILIKRNVTDYDKDTGVFTHNSTPGSADLYNQLNGWATQTHDEKLDSVKNKYVKDENNDNVLVLKPKPKDLDDE